MSEKVNNIFDSIVKNDNKTANMHVGAAIREKMQDAYEVRKVGLTSTIFNKKEDEK